MNDILREMYIASQSLEHFLPASALWSVGVLSALDLVRRLLGIAVRRRADIRAPSSDASSSELLTPEAQPIGEISTTINVDSEDVSPVTVATNISAEPEPIMAPSSPTVVTEQLTPQRSVSVSQGLKRSRATLLSRLKSYFQSERSSAEVYEQLEELLISSDLGVKTTERLLTRVRERLNGEAHLEVSLIKNELRALLTEILEQRNNSALIPEKIDGRTKVIAIIGVNGVGKTTTIGKLASKFAHSGKTVVVAACDTFRAAAVQQLEEWASRAGAKVVKGEPEAKPTTVAYLAAKEANSANADVLLIDTAGRLHTRVNLMNELSSVMQILARELPGAPHESILVLDGATGQNALQQAREFHGKVPLSGLIVTKLDGTPKGGIVVAIKEELGIPVRYIGIGEGVDDLREFDSDEFISALLDDDDAPGDDAAPAELSENAKIRRRRRTA